KNISCSRTLLNSPGHLLGTARMGLDPMRSVVNEWGRCHDVKNLFIVDGSIWVTSGGVNPTSTIQALALYIADNIKMRLAPVFDYTYDGVMRSLEHSHLRLGLARIDIALIHDIDFWTIKDRAVLAERFKTVMDSGFKALDELRKAGIIGAIGVGINEADTSLRFIQAGNFDCMLLAGRYTLLEQGGLEAFLPECVKRNVSVILGGPYNSGILTGGVTDTATHDYAQAPTPLIDKARRIEAVCQRHGVELGAAAMQFPLFHP